MPATPRSGGGAGQLLLARDLAANETLSAHAMLCTACKLLMYVTADSLPPTPAARSAMAAAEHAVHACGDAMAAWRHSLEALATEVLL